MAKQSHPTWTKRINPADVPLASMDRSSVDFLLGIDAFKGLDPKFRESPAFRKIIEKDSSLVEYDDGDIIIREGDWGNSAYFVISGTVHVELEPEGEFPLEFLGRSVSKRKSVFGALAQWWSNHRHAEYRNVATYQSATGTSQRKSGTQTRIYLQDVPAVLERYRNVKLKPGALFGELAALGRTRRTATVFASGGARLLEMRWQGLRDLMRRDPGFRKQIDESFRSNALRSFLMNSPTFSHISDDPVNVVEVIQSAELQTYGEYDKVGTFRELVEEGTRNDLAGEPVIAREGDYPNGILMVRSGLARVSRRHHNGHLTVGYLCPGQVFGFEEIAEGYTTGAPIPLRHSLRAIGFISVILIPTTTVEKHLMAGRPVDPPAPAPRPASSAGPQLQAHRLNEGFVEFLIQERFVNGTATMLIDLDRCTRCDDCVKACAAAHDNNPRFVRQGPINNQVMVANACMHCQDPVCMIECPTGAISRHADEGVVQINDATCVGCASCANNCPYNAIRMVEIRREDGSFIRDNATQLPIVKATKCDLCVDQLGGPACQRACPHDALIRMDMRELDRLADWRSR
jgi:Fe-S-cluster-containing dehydrogenase component/CRP-like cAMP-binding protein